MIRPQNWAKIKLMKQIDEITKRGNTRIGRMHQ